MAISVNQVTINTKVNKQAKENAKAQKSYSKGLSKMDMEAIIQECMDRVKAMMEYELRR